MNFSRPSTLLVGLLSLAVLVGAVFAPVIGFEFVRWDDDINITQNPLLTEPWSWQWMRDVFSADQALRFKPVHWLLDRAVYAAFGYNPAAWHALNLGLHGAATGLFFVVVRTMFARRSSNAREVELAAWMAAAMWAVHPLRAEVVGWATASPYSLAAVFLLGSFQCYLTANGKPAHPRRWWVAAWLLAVAAYGSYPVSVTYGFWLMAVDAWWLGTAPDRASAPAVWRGWILKHAAFLGPAVLAVAVTMWTRIASPGIFTDAPGIADVGFGPRLAMALASVGHLTASFFWPVNLTPNVSRLNLDASTLLTLAAVAVLVSGGLAWIWMRRRDHPWLALSAFGLAAISLPCLGWTERPTWPVDRYSYVAHLILVGALAGGVWAGAVRRAQFRVAAVVTGAIAIAAAGWATRTQVETWRDSGTLFSAMERHPDFTANPRQAGHVYTLWGREVASGGDAERAQVLFGRARSAYLGGIKQALGRADYEEALSLLTHIEHHFGLTPELQREKGAWLLRTGRIEEAFREVSAALAARPDDGRAAALLAEVLAARMKK